MAKKQGLGSTRRFGPRYGRTVKHKLAKIEKLHRARHTCPYCSRQTAKRKSAGIWHCSKCDSTFAAKAYTVGERPVAVRESAQIVTEAIELEMEK